MEAVSAPLVLAQTRAAEWPVWSLVAAPASAAAVGWAQMAARPAVEKAAVFDRRLPES